MIRPIVLLSVLLAGSAAAAGGVRAADAQLGIDAAAASAQAVVFADGVISTPQEELAGSFSPDHRQFYFTKSAPNYTDWFHTIVVSRSENGRWRTPEVASFSGRYADSSPFVTQDGSKLFFGSNRPVDGVAKTDPQDSDLWVVERKPDGGWGEPRHLGPKVNSSYRDSHPSVAADGTLYFQSSRPRGKAAKTDIANLYRSRLVDGEYQAAEDLGEAINTDKFEMDPYIAPDQSFLLFGSNGHPGLLSGLDLYISFNRDGAWTPPRDLGPKVNGGQAASGGFQTTIGGRRYLFFNSLSGREIGRKYRRPDRALSYEELQAVLDSVEYGSRNFYYMAWDALGLDAGP